MVTLYLAQQTKLFSETRRASGRPRLGGGDKLLLLDSLLVWAYIIISYIFIVDWITKFHLKKVEKYGKIRKYQNGD